MIVDGCSQHDQLAAYVRQLSNCQDGRGGVWLEHSYARGGGGGTVRVLVGRAPAPRAAPVDVTTVTEPPRLPIGGTGLAVPDEAGSEEEGWEERLWAAAPSAAHRELAAAALQLLYDLRLQLLTQKDVPGSEWLQEHSIRTTGRRLRIAAVGGAGGSLVGGSTWVCNALTACLPPYLLHLYRAASAATTPAPPRPVEPSANSESIGVCGVWVGEYGVRWREAVSRVLPCRALPQPTTDLRLPPDQYTTGVATEAMPHLMHMLTGPTVVCGFGAGAAVAAALCSAAVSPHIRGLVLLAPPLHTADNSYHSISQWSRGVPTLLVLGGSGAAVSGAARLVCVAPADDDLKLSSDAARRLRLPPAAIRAAVAEEIARWSNELMQPKDEPRSDGNQSSPGERATPEEGEYLHLPTLASVPPPSTNHRSKRSIEIIEGRVVSRVAGGTPLPLSPPRRAAPPVQITTPAAPPVAMVTTPAPLAAADILQMPIVFADDDIDTQSNAPTTKLQELTVRPAAAPLQPELVTVTSGHPRVIGAGGALSVRRVVVSARRAAAPMLLRRSPNLHLPRSR